MKIGVIADTHDSLPGNVVDALRDVDEIWHLGDVTQPEVIQVLSGLDIPVQVVRGNCDFHRDWPETLTLQRNGRTFFLVHIPLHQAPHGVDVLLHGHTHVPRDEVMEGCRFLNPGTVAGSYKGAPHGYAFLFVDEEGQIRWEQVTLTDG